MQWYEINQFKPPLSIELFVRLEKKPEEDVINVKYIVASILSYNYELSDPDHWLFLRERDFLPYYSKCLVTHFAIPAPVAREK